MLRNLGHTVRVAERYEDQSCDLLVALHARRSAAAVRRFRDRHAGTPCIVALTGTDLYRDLGRSAAAQRSVQLADWLVVLQPDALQWLPPDVHDKTHVICQSATAAAPRPPLKSVFEICVIGHLRQVKDPFRTAMAVRLLPKTSRIQVAHMGAALTPAMRQRALAETKKNPRYEWLGELTHGKTKRRLARARLMVLTSRMEGGANVVAEALAAGVPVLSTRISGSAGVLGTDYPGYFEVGDTQQLTELLVRAENDKRWYAQLKGRCQKLARLISPQREQAAWAKLLRLRG